MGIPAWEKKSRVKRRFVDARPTGEERKQLYYRLSYQKANPKKSGFFLD